MATGRLVGKTCVITGAAHGIAKATAQLFVAEGASVLLADRDAVAGERVAWLLREQGATAQFVETDVSDEIAVGRMIDAGRDLGGGKVFSIGSHPSLALPSLLPPRTLHHPSSLALTDHARSQHICTLPMSHFSYNQDPRSGQRGWRRHHCET